MTTIHDVQSIVFQKKAPLKVVAKDPKYLPVYASSGAAGADLKAAIDEPCILEPGCVMAVPTGIFLEIPGGFEVQVRPRSGLALKQHVTVLNAPGTIDSDYRGEVTVILINHGKNSFVIEPGMRIAQMVLAPVLQANFVLAHALETTTRGSGGFGHTGVH